MARILIVDDSPVTREMLRELLEEMGHEICGEAEESAGALALFSDTAPDLVLL
ncbi:MAG: response regulator, partial [bacterium]